MKETVMRLLKKMTPGGTGPSASDGRSRATTNVVYREIRHGELSFVLRLGHEYFAELGMPVDYYDQKQLEQQWTILSAVYPTALFTAWEGEQCLGGMGVCLFREEYSPLIFVGEIFLFVRPMHRGRGIEDQLIRMAEIWGHALGAKEMRLGRFSHTPGLGMYYESKGYKLFRCVHRKEL